MVELDRKWFRLGQIVLTICSLLALCLLMVLMLASPPEKSRGLLWPVWSITYHSWPYFTLCTGCSSLAIMIVVDVKKNDLAFANSVGCAMMLLWWAAIRNQLEGPRGWILLSVAAVCVLMICVMRAAGLRVSIVNLTGGRHTCSKCGYCLVGNVTGTCPECGRTITSLVSTEIEEQDT